MTIKTQINFRQYRKLLFRLIYRKPIMRVIVGVGVAMLVWISGYYLHLLPLPKPEIYQFIALGLISVVQPLGIYLTIKRSYDSSNHFGEDLEITAVPEKLSVRGESFHTELIWEKLFKIEEEPGYILIYQNTLTAIIIDKKDLSETSLSEFKSILRNVPRVPVHLKKNS
jgi:hypothetical protein